MRVALYLLALILVVPTLIRVVLTLLKAVLAPGQPQGRARQAGGRPTDIPVQGELKRDPVCGTYVSTATSVKKMVDGEVVYFCSEACRAKHG